MWIDTPGSQCSGIQVRFHSFRVGNMLSDLFFSRRPEFSPQQAPKMEWVLRRGDSLFCFTHRVLCALREWPLAERPAESVMGIDGICAERHKSIPEQTHSFSSVEKWAGTNFAGVYMNKLSPRRTQLFWKWRGAGGASLLFLPILKMAAAADCAWKIQSFHSFFFWSGARRCWLSKRLLSTEVEELAALACASEFRNFPTRLQQEGGHAGNQWIYSTPSFRFELALCMVTIEIELEIPWWKLLMNFVSFIRRLSRVIDLENYFWETVLLSKRARISHQCHVTAAGGICQLQFSSHSRSKSLKSISHTHSACAPHARVEARVCCLPGYCRQNSVADIRRPRRQSASPRWLFVINLCSTASHQN